MSTHCKVTAPTSQIQTSAQTDAQTSNPKSDGYVELTASRLDKKHNALLRNSFIITFVWYLKQKMSLHYNKQQEVT